MFNQKFLKRLLVCSYLKTRANLQGKMKQRKVKDPKSYILSEIKEKLFRNFRSFPFLY